MTQKVLIPLAPGAEEIEVVCLVDVLRRAKMQVVLAAVGDLLVTASRGVKLVADASLAQVTGEHFDLIVLPGGARGAENLRDCPELIDLLNAQVQAGQWVGAICASPAVVLAHHGFLQGVRATAYPSYAHLLPEQSAISSRVVVDGKFVTSQGPGTAIEFALTLVEFLQGKDKALEIKNDLIAL
jgi:4-methyl-5(b-hydroxyethyl)-thiazole monophosphate biosynthesis